MLDRLPIFINPLKFSEKGKKLLGTVEISELSRLSDKLLDKTGAVDVDFSFDKEGRTPTIKGEIRVNLKLECQSCGEPIDWVVKHSFKLGVVLSLEQADNLSSDLEPLILDSDKVSTVGLVEDELLLALPDFPRHEQVCVKSNETLFTTEINEQINSNNPFSVLAKLKILENKDGSTKK